MLLSLGSGISWNKTNSSKWDSSNAFFKIHDWIKGNKLFDSIIGKDSKILSKDDAYIIEIKMAIYFFIELTWLGK